MASDSSPRLGRAARRRLALVELAFAEIRLYGVSSLQVCRRLRAVLEDLRSSTLPIRHAAIDEQLEQLRAAVERTYPAESAELEIAEGADRAGIGLGRVT